MCSISSFDNKLKSNPLLIDKELFVYSIVNEKMWTARLNCLVLYIFPKNKKDIILRLIYFRNLDLLNNK